MEPTTVVDAGSQIVSTFMENGFINTCAVLFVIQWPIIVFCMLKYAGPITRYTEAQEKLADNSELHTEDHKIIKEGVNRTCQGVEYLKGRVSQ